MTTFARGQRVIGAATHYVENQPPWRVDVNEFALNTPLVGAVGAFGGGWADAELGEAGALVGSESFQRDAELADIHSPKAYSHDRWGFRLDEVEYDPAYHRVIGEAIARGAHTSAWADPRPGSAVARAAMFMLFAQVEPGHACPVSMTHAAVASIAGSPWIADEWLPRLYSRDYDPRLITPVPKRSALIGMAMTEKQGGSDVRAGTTEGVSMGGHAYSLTGHKWFCSAPMSDGFLVLAHTRHGMTDEGLSCLFVPRLLPHDVRNVFRIQRLKDKLGNRSNASAEIEFDGTVGFILGEPGRGVRTIIEMVQRTRLDCVLGTAAGMRQSVAEARMACARSRGIRRPADRSARYDLGARRSGARGRGRDADRPAARPAVRGRMHRTGMSPCADSRRRCRSTGSASAARITPTRRSSAWAATATPSRSRSRDVTASSRCSRSGRARATSSPSTCCAR